MKRKGFLALLMVATMALAVACGSSSKSNSYSDGLAKAGEPGTFSFDSLGFNDSAASADYDYADSPTELDPENQAYDFERKLIYNSSLNIETKKFDEDVAAVKELVAANGGYFDNSNMSGSEEYGTRAAGFTARIPSDKYEAFMNSLGEIGSVTYRSENVEDITSNYVDVQARLKSLNTKRQRLEELEQQADKLEDLLEIEDRINDVQYQIESNTAQLKLYDKQVEYCTVTISVDEVVTYTEVKADTFWNRFVEALENSGRDFLLFIENFIVALVYMLPYIILIVVILFVIIRVRRRKGKGKLFKRKNKEKAEKQAEESADKQA